MTRPCLVDMEGRIFACLLKEVIKRMHHQWGCHERRSWGGALTATDMVVVFGVFLFVDGATGVETMEAHR